MILVAIKDNTVVAIEQNGSIDTSVDHDLIVSVPDNSNPVLGFDYAAPALINPPPTQRYFFSKTLAAEHTLKPMVYVDDGNGNPVLVENPEELA